MRRSTTIVGALAGLGALLAALVILDRRDEGRGLAPGSRTIQTSSTAEPPRLVPPTAAEAVSPERQAEPISPPPDVHAAPADPPEVTVLVRSEETGLPLPGPSP